MILEKYSMGIGDRFGRQGKAQLRAMVLAAEAGVDVVPVWNKSRREHTIVHTGPAAVRAEADAATRALGWTGAYHVDADHIGLASVDPFIEASDFFTLDVADLIGRTAGEDEIRAFVDKHARCVGDLAVAGVDRMFRITREQIEAVAARFLLAVKEAGRIHRHVAAAKGAENFITEVSMDETDQPQTPEEVLFILAAVADEGIPAQTIAPKFTGRFNKGVDYVGDVAAFTKQFNEHLAVIAFAIAEFGLSGNLKLSIHSGSDKFSLYGPIRRAVAARGAGLHVKTAGTTWLAELTGLALAGGEALAIARDVYRESVGRLDDLCRPYAAVVDIDTAQLPAPQTVDSWSGEQFAGALRHDPSCPAYNRHFRQLLHVAYKLAAEMGERYLGALDEFEEFVAAAVTENIHDHHLKPIFIGE